MKLFNNQVEKVYDFIQNDGEQDLKNNLLKKKLKLQASKLFDDNQSYDILLTILYRTNDNIRLPIGLNFLAAYIGQFGYKAKVLGITAHNLLDIIESELEAKKTPIIGFYCSYDNVLLVKNVIRYLKKKLDITVFVGGPQAVDLDEEFIKETGCDIVTEGEGEEALKELMDYYINKVGDLKNIKNIKYVDNDCQYHQNEIRQHISDLDILPFPSIKSDEKSEVQIKDVGYILTGRGCPYRCTFCYEGAHSKIVRYRSIKNVFEEINYILKENPQTRFIQVYDDTFTLDTKRVHDFCEEMKKVREKHSNLYWCCEAHVNTLYKDNKIVLEMVEAGLHNIQIGIESGSLKVLDAYNKKITSEMICDVVKMCNDSKLNVMEGNFIVGGACESRETIDESIELAKKLIRVGVGMIELNPVFFAPYPKTAITKLPEKYGIQFIEDQVEKTLSSMANAVTRTQELSRDEIVDAFKRFEVVLREEYKKLTLQLDKTVIFKKFLYDDKNIKVKSKWGASIASYEHMKNYIKIATKNNYRFTNIGSFESWYPIRTFEPLEYIDNQLNVNGILFDNTEMKILEYSSGRYNISKIARIIGADPNSVFRVCSELERRCYLYYSLI